MIASALKELLESAEADLPGWIDAVAVHHNVELERGFAVHDWWKTATDFAALKFPLLSITWQATTSSVRGSNGRRATHRFLASYGFRAADFVVMQRHITVMPEALLRWLDEFPTLSKRPGEGRTILAIGLEPDGRTTGAIEMVHGPAFRKNESGESSVFAWAVDLDFTVITHDAPLPALIT